MLSNLSLQATLAQNGERTAPRFSRINSCIIYQRYFVVI